MINVKAFTSRTDEGLKASLAYSRKKLDHIDPNFEDIEGRKACLRHLELREEQLEIRLDD